MNTLAMNAYDAFHRSWALVTAGEMGHFNTMTVSWGSVGCLWNKPVVTVYVRPSRYTFEFLEEYDCFTVSFYPEENKKMLGILGSVSGRDCDKVALAGFDPVPFGGSVTFAQARTTLLCRKLYAQDMDPEQIPGEVREKFYSEGETLHRIYIGQIIAVHGEESEA
mgnify:CR=1 FL=1